MKDYLKENLTNEEKLYLLGIIYRTARTYKKRLLKSQEKFVPLIEDIDLAVEDEYTFYNIDREMELERNSNCLSPYTDQEKVDIIKILDQISKELAPLKYVGTLTFNEKLVFFLFYLKQYKGNEVATLLKIDRRTVLNRRNAIINKMEQAKKGGDVYDKWI